MRTERRSASSLLSSCFNNGKIEILDSVPDSNKKVVNEIETIAAQQKAQEIKEEWQDWIYKDASRRNYIAAIYNATFNTYVPSKYDGSLLQLNNASVTPYQIQRNVVLRTLLNQNTFIDHSMGAGKTFSFVASVMEHRRIYPNTRAMVVVPNEILSQFANAASAAYPHANILLVETKNLSIHERNETLARISVSDFDMCIIPECAFSSIPAPIEFQQELIQEQIDDLYTAITNLENKDFNAKRLENKVARLEEKLENLKITHLINPPVISWEDLNISFLCADEIHLFKNLFFSTSFSNVAGLGNTNGSKRAFDFYCKALHVQANGGKLVGGTGTKLLNSITELNNWFRLFLPEKAKVLNLGYLDCFCSAFALPHSEYEIAPSGSGYKLTTRLRTYTNLPELENIYLSFADVVTEDDLKEALPKFADGRCAIPALKNNKPTTIYLEPTQPQIDGFKDIVEKAKHLDKKSNMLALINRGRSLSLDARLVYPNTPNYQQSKVNKMASNVAKIHSESEENMGTQIIFIDRSIPARHKAGEAKYWGKLFRNVNAGKASQEELSIVDGLDQNEMETAINSTFSIYDELVNLLISTGIPEHEIAIIHDYKTNAEKDALRLKMNSGEIRVLLGTTWKLSTGWNINERLVALHHGDLPLRVGDLQQREGRILRTNNKLWFDNPLFTVEIIHYLTKRTLDGWQLGLLDVKQKFIKAFASGKRDTNYRIYEEPTDNISFSELAAIVSDDPIMLDHVKAQSNYRKLNALKRKFEATTWQRESNIEWHERELARLYNDISHLKASLKHFNSLDLNNINIDVGDQTISYSNKSALNRSLESFFQARKYRSTLQYTICKIGNFTLSFKRKNYEDEYYLTTTNSSHSFAVNGQTGKTLIKNVLFFMFGFESLMNNKIANAKHRKEAIKTLTALMCNNQFKHLNDWKVAKNHLEQLTLQIAERDYLQSAA